jgi:tetraacyldisaccharide 4'-kinase
LNKTFASWIEQYLFYPNWYQKLISIFLLPLTMLYCIVVAFKRVSSTPIEFGLPIISIGNLIVGGSGKTPLTIELAKEFEDAFVVLRGYGRKSKGLHLVSLKGKIKVDVDTSGDEAMVLAKKLQKCSIIVSEDRKAAIIKAKELGAKVVFLDDGFSKSDIKKLDILIRPKKEPTNIFCLPSGGYRDTKMLYSMADMVLKDGIDFKRVVSFKLNEKTLEFLPKNTTVITSISKPDRLKEFLTKDVNILSFSDHYNFTQEDMDKILKEFPNVNFAGTQKDLVKLEKLDLKDKKLYLIDLKIDILNAQVKQKVNNYYESYYI